MTQELIESYGTVQVLMLAGFVVGILFGSTAQHSRFCLRASVVEVVEKNPASRFAIWLIAFSTAVLITQTALYFGYLDVSETRQLASIGSTSGAIIGGLLFGCGMILARGCASRLLVLSATGNLRALMTGLLLTLVAQASLSGVLAPVRLYISQIWMLEGRTARDLFTWIPLDKAVVLTLIGGTLVLGVGLGLRHKFPLTRMLSAFGVGLAVALGWVLTYQISQNSFDLVSVQSVTFTGPSTDTLMVLVSSDQLPFNFGIGLVLGVFMGSGLAALLSREWKIDRFGPDTPMERYIVGAVFMGFGAMLAGGCAVGAGVSGSAIFSLTAWVAIFFMWVGASLTHHITQKTAKGLSK